MTHPNVPARLAEATAALDDACQRRDLDMVLRKGAEVLALSGAADADRAAQLAREGYERGYWLRHSPPLD